MMKYEGKECKTFINKLVKLINGINKYNFWMVLTANLHFPQHTLLMKGVPK